MTGLKVDEGFMGDGQHLPPEPSMSSDKGFRALLNEFDVQILEHAEKLVELLGVHASVFSNAGLFYNDDIGRRVAASAKIPLGFMVPS